MRTIHTIVLHHSASPFGCVSVIRRWHLDRDFNDIGYHACILNGYLTSANLYQPKMDGAIEIGRPWERIGAHAKGHNTESLGICLVGQGTFSIAQYASLKKLVLMLKSLWPDVTILGHRDLAATQCPGIDCQAWCQREGF